MDTDLLRADLAALYPQFGITVAHSGVVLAPPTDAELFELAAIVGEPGGILEPGQERFVSWPTGSPDAVDAFLHRHWGLRVRPIVGRWHLPFAVLAEGRAIGVAAVVCAGEADATIDTRSWIARADQGRGLGRRVRLMMLELAFVHLGITTATSTAAIGNLASQRISARCGYAETGRSVARDGTPEIRYAITPAAWRRRRLTDVRVDGVEPFLAAITPGRAITPGGAITPS